MKKIVCLCLYAIVICASDIAGKKELECIKRLEKLARVARENGLNTLSDAYLRKVKKLMEAQRIS